VDVKFRCIKECALCCHYQSPLLTSDEINKIITYLNSLKDEVFKDFILNVFGSLGRIEESTKDNMELFRKTMLSFWRPNKYDEIDNGLIVRNYSISSTPSSGRCIFLDPFELTCFIYAARPYTCQLYPVSFEFNETGKNKVVMDKENCPGIGVGDKLYFKEIEQIQLDFLNAFIKDMDNYRNYIEENNIVIKKKERIINTDRTEYLRNQGTVFTRLNKKIFEPLVEKGLIPKQSRSRTHTGSSRR
jgi:Fe-S-cluster containining protein